jgi:hypothetical protein
MEILFLRYFFGAPVLRKVVVLRGYLGQHAYGVDTISLSMCLPVSSSPYARLRLFSVSFLNLS